MNTSSYCHWMIFWLFFFVHFNPTSSLSSICIWFLLCSSFFILHHAHDKMTKTQYDWYWYTGLPTPNIGCQTTTQSTWLWSPQNSPSLTQSLDPALEPFQWPSPLPTIQSSGLPELRTQGVVRPLCRSLVLSKGSSKLLQQDHPNLELPFIEPLPQTFQGSHLLQPERGSLLHHPPASQQHCPTEFS